jgi:hypothetical protein
MYVVVGPMLILLLLLGFSAPLDEAFKVSHDEWTVTLTQYVNLTHDFVRLGLITVGIGHDLDSHDCICGPVTSAVHFTEGPFTKDLVKLELGRSIMLHQVNNQIIE